MANFDTPPGLDSWCGLSLPLARTQCRHQLRNGKCANSCCSTSASLSRGLRFGGTRSVLLEAHQHFDLLWSRLYLCRCTSSQPIHTTSTFGLHSIASEPIEDRSISTEERDDNASIAHLSHRDNRPLQSSVLGCNLAVTRHVDTVWCAQANCAVVCKHYSARHTQHFLTCGSRLSSRLKMKQITFEFLPLYSRS